MIAHVCEVYISLDIVSGDCDIQGCEWDNGLWRQCVYGAAVQGGRNGDFQLESPSYLPLVNLQ